MHLEGSGFEISKGGGGGGGGVNAPPPKKKKPCMHIQCTL